jgi:hypothetical protein
MKEKEMTTNTNIEPTTVTYNIGTATITAIVVAGAYFFEKFNHILSQAACSIIVRHPQLVVEEHDVDKLMLSWRGYGALPYGGEGERTYEAGIIKYLRSSDSYAAFTRSFGPDGVEHDFHGIHLTPWNAAQAILDANNAE